MADQEYKQGTIRRFGTGSFNTELENQQWDKHLYDMFLEANAQFIPFIDKFGGGSHASKSYKLQWGEYDQEMVSMTAASVGDGSSIVVTGTEYLPVIKDDILYSSVRDVYLRVTATPTDTATIAVRKITASSIDTALVAGDYAAGVVWKRLYTQKSDGTIELETTLNEISAHKTAADKYNYIGTFEKFSKIDTHEANQSWRFDSEMDKRTHENMVKMKEMLNELEYHAFKGKLVTVAGTTHIAMGNGILNFDGINSDSGTEGMTWAQFTNWVRTKVKLKNKMPKIPVMCNYQGLDWMSRLLKDTFNTNISGQGDKTKAGLAYTEVVTPGAIIQLYPNYALGELFPNTSELIALDPKTVSRHHITNMNLETNYGVQPKRAHFFLDQIYGTQGWELANAAKLSKLSLSSV
jgi:hypothetical protein